MLATVLVAVLGAANLHEPIRLAALPFEGSKLDANKAELFGEYLAQQLGGRGIQVTTPKQIASVVGIERQKELLGCEEDSGACLAELGNALGADGLLSGEIARLEGGDFQITLRVADPTRGRALASYTASAGSEAAILDELTFAARSMAPELARALKRVLPPPTTEVLVAEDAAQRPLRRSTYLPAVAGGALLAGSGFLYLQSQARASLLRTGSGRISGAEARTLRDSGQQLQVLSAVALGAGCAAVATAAGFYLWKSEREAPKGSVSISAGLSPGGGGLVLSGVMP